MCMGGSNNAGSDARTQQMQQQAQVDQATGQINNAFAGFTPQFYNDRAQAYTNYAEPQLIQQYQQAGQQLLGKLANQGLLNSSAALQEKGALQNTMNTQQQGIANQGIQQSQQLQQQVGQQQANLVSQANAASDPLSVAQLATGTAAGYAAPSAFAPIGPLFQGFANQYLGSQLNSTYNPSLYGYMLGQGGGSNQLSGGNAGLGSSSS